MTGTKTVVTVDWEHHGVQLRPYGGTTWSGILTYRVEYPPVSYAPDGVTILANETMVKRAIDGLVAPFLNPGDDWFVPRLVDLEDLGEGLWRFLLERPYDD